MDVFTFQKYFSETNISIYKAIKKIIGRLFIIIIIGLFLDSKYLNIVLPNSQVWANVLMLGGFIYKYRKSQSRVRQLMIYAVIIGFIGEHLFSIVLNMYTYRHGNIPLYVPLGHAIIFLGPFFFCRQPAIKLHKKKVERFFTILILIYGALFLIFTNDVFGFVMTILTVVVLYFRPKERLYFLTMYIVVAFLEIIGTSYGNWAWPDTAFNTFAFLPSYNPPSGISFFYFSLDLGCLFLYRVFNRKSWSRMQKIKELRE